MCGEHVAMAAVLPYVWSDACRDRVFPSLLPFFHAHGAHCPTPANSEGPLAVSPYAWSTSITHPCQMRGAQFFSMRMEHIAKSLPGPIRAPLSLHIQSYSKRSLLGCIVVLHIII